MKIRSLLYSYFLPAFLLIPLAGCSSVSQEQSDQRPFYQEEYGTRTHGRKTWFDHLIEVDPGGLDVQMADDYLQRPPANIAVLPFTDKGSANYTLDMIPLTFRDKEQRHQWAWTDAQRLRRSLVGYMSEREFIIVNPIAVDAVLKEHGIDNGEKLKQASVLDLGKWLGCDAVVYGQVNHYEAWYFALVSAYQVGVETRMVSTHDGETLMRSTGSRFAVDLRPAMDLQDIAINSVLSLLELRDVTLARAEEEVTRELILRIPVSDKLRFGIAHRAIEKSHEGQPEEEASSAAQMRGEVRTTVNPGTQYVHSTDFSEARSRGD